tara:strand:+ start:289 stop:1005 length:717 start_codon:yes stop_codon:yes gene_type:complete
MKQPYKLYTDKDQDFECQLHLEGISMEKTRARIVVEGNGGNLTFGGTINKNGKCTIPISGLSNKLGDSSGGMMRLEVLAGDIYFQPWKSAFTIDGRKFDEISNITEETGETSVELQMEIYNIKQDIKDISGKVDNIIEGEDEKYNKTFEKWKSLNNDLPDLSSRSYDISNKKSIDILEEKMILNPIKGSEEYKKTVDKWSALNKNLNEDLEKKEKINKKKDYKDIVDKWGAIDNDLEI